MEQESYYPVDTHATNAAFSIQPPRGLEALYSKCRSVYPNQQNPLQVTAVVKYWLGGPDPLDYISMYANDGDTTKNVPPHWHYVSFGMSDLHGDGRVHDNNANIAVNAVINKPSGFGFELTFRLLREPGESSPPTWPATLMQALAKYVFHSGNTLCAGDHVSWHCALDYSESRIHHMLMCMDPEMGTVLTPFGVVDFIQIVGVTKEELQSAQHWNVPGVLEILKGLNGTGGEWLVTDVRRGESMQEIDPAIIDTINRGIEEEGSNLSGVSARCSWVEVDNESGSDRPTLRSASVVEQDVPRISLQDSQQIKSELAKGLLSASSIKTEEPDGKEFELMHLNKDCFGAESTELITTQYMNGIHLTFNLESGNLLPLCIRGRVKHGRHFTFKSLIGDTAITFVASSVTGAFVTPSTPYAAHGPWVQVLLAESLAVEMANDLDILSSSNNEELTLPKTFSWDQYRLYITIVGE